MSLAHVALIRFPNKKVFFAGYSGVVDAIMTPLFATEKEMWDFRNDGDKYFEYTLKKEKPKCRHKIEKVQIASLDYKIFQWPGKACLKCMEVIEGKDRFEAKGVRKREAKWTKQYAKNATTLNMIAVIKK